MQHLSVTAKWNVQIPKWLCHSLRVSSVYIVDFSILQHWAEDFINICGLHSMLRTVLYANTTAQQFSPSFSCFSPAQFTKNSPVGRCQTQLRTLPLISSRHCNSVVPSTMVFSSQTPRSSSWRCRCCSQIAPSHYQKIMTRHMTLDDQLNSTLQFTYLI